MWIFDADKIWNLLKTIGFYGILVGVTCILHYSSPGGPCVPSGGLLFLLFAAPISAIVLIIRNLYLLSKGKKEHVLSLFAHVLVILSFIIMIGGH